MTLLPFPPCHVTPRHAAISALKPYTIAQVPLLAASDTQPEGAHQMIVERLDHVNIIASDLGASARFYADLLDLEARDAPPPMKAEHMQWMYDASGQAVLHLNSVECRRLYDREVSAGETTGALHHVAFRCQNFDRVKARLDARGADYRVNEASTGGLMQIFTHDPDNVLLELNFFSD